MHVSLEQKPTLGEIGGSKMETSEDGTNQGVPPPPSAFLISTRDFV